MADGGLRFGPQLQSSHRRALCVMATAILLNPAVPGLRAQPPSLEAVFPAGGQAGQTTEISVQGSQLEVLTSLHCSLPGSTCEPAGAGVFRMTLPADAPPGHYDLWGVGPNGVTAARSFVVGNLPEQQEIEPNDLAKAATQVPLNTITNGRISSADPDWYRFEARAGECVVIECWAERIDSTLRAVLEVTDAAGRRVAVNRGYFGIDPAIVLNVPHDGEYLVRVHDLVGSTSPLHVYRLSIGAGPRVVFAVPDVIQRGTTARITLYGWNLTAGQTLADDATGFDRIDVEVAADDSRRHLPVLRRPSQSPLADAAMSYLLPGSSIPIALGLTEALVLVDSGANHTAAEAQEISLPSETTGQLVSGDECDWYAIRASRGDVLYLEAYGERIGSPVDLQLGVHDESGREIAAFSDETVNLGGTFATNHLDPAGRWVCPTDGRYLISLRNLIGGLSNDPRRTYRLSVRREEPEVHVVVVPQGETQSGVTLPRGGRIALDLLAIRERGMTGEIRVSAVDLPPGLQCPDVCLGPGATRGIAVVSADDAVTTTLAELRLEATPVAANAATGISRRVQTGTVVRSGTPGGRGRIVSQLPLSVAGESAVRITATADEPLDHHLYGPIQVRHAPGSIVDVHVDVARRESTHLAPVRLTTVGLPDAIDNATAIIPPGEHHGYVSLRLPASLATGNYSLAVVAETTAATDGKVESVRVVSNPVTIRVEPAAFRVEIDPFSITRVRRGETFTLGYSAKRLNGFIGKLHTELAVPGRVTEIPGLRGRGETFVSQTDHGSLQITVNDDAPLGPQPFLRLLTVGVVEDEPTYYGSCWVPLEIVE